MKNVSLLIVLAALAASCAPPAAPSSASNPVSGPASVYLVGEAGSGQCWWKDGVKTALHYVESLDNPENKKFAADYTAAYGKAPKVEERLPKESSQASCPTEQRSSSSFPPALLLSRRSPFPRLSSVRLCQLSKGCPWCKECTGSGTRKWQELRREETRRRGGGEKKIKPSGGKKNRRK